jgi:hypothetical protein
MNDRALIPQHRADLVGSTIPSVEWREALDTFLNTLNSPRTAIAYQRAVIEAMEAIGVDYVADVTAPMLAEYRGWLVSRPDAEREDKLSPATVNLKLAGVRQFLRFCLVTGITGLSKDAIAFVLRSPRSTVEKPYEVLNQSERAALLAAAQASNAREYALIALGLGAGLRVSELVKVRLEGFSQDEAGYWWVKATFPDIPLPAISEFERGGIVGTVEYQGTMTEAPLNNYWFFGPYGWILKSARPIEFVPYKGQLGLFEIEIDQFWWICWRRLLKMETCILRDYDARQQREVTRLAVLTTRKGEKAATLIREMFISTKKSSQSGSLWHRSTWRQRLGKLAYRHARWTTI